MLLLKLFINYYSMGFPGYDLTLCIGSGLSSRSSSKLPEIARFNSGPASCNVLSPAF